MDILCKPFGNDPNVRAAAIVCGTYGSYFLFYSGWKKPSSTSQGLEPFKGTWEPQNELPKIFAPANLGSQPSNRQLNKVAALCGLSMGGMCALPDDMWKGMAQERTTVLKVATGSLLAHFAYSFVSFYEYNPIALIKGEATGKKFEQLAVLCGSVSQLAFVWAAYKVGIGKLIGLNASQDAQVLLAASALGVTHFYFMETKTGLPGNLPVRPWGYWSFIMPLAAVGLGLKAAIC